MGRKYRMGERAVAVEETRRRILEATMEVHDEQGIVAGRWPDIAQRAGVSLATVYRHFPTLEELAVACGALTLEVVDHPTPEGAPAVFEGATSTADRVERLVREAFGFYERGGRLVENVRRDRDRLDAVGEAHAHFERGLDALVEQALKPLRIGRAERKAVRALIDERVWAALRDHGHSAEAAVKAAIRLVEGTIGDGR